MRARLFLQTVLISTAAAILYGLIHDQITIRICPEYFTVWHPHVSNSENLTIVALIWGVIATWWMGAFLGMLLGACATVGHRPVPPFKFVARSIVLIMLSSAAAAILAGVICWQVRWDAPSSIMGPQIIELAPEARRRFSVDLAIHNASYNFAPIAAIIAGIAIWRYRRRLAPPAARPTFP